MSSRSSAESDWTPLIGSKQVLLFTPPVSGLTEASERGAGAELNRQLAGKSAESLCAISRFTPSVDRLSALVRAQGTGGIFGEGPTAMPLSRPARSPKRDPKNVEQSFSTSIATSRRVGRVRCRRRNRIDRYVRDLAHRHRDAEPVLLQQLAQLVVTMSSIGVAPSRFASRLASAMNLPVVISRRFSPRPAIAPDVSYVVRIDGACVAFGPDGGFAQPSTTHPPSVSRNPRGAEASPLIASTRRTRRTCCLIGKSGDVVLVVRRRVRG
jgi:hypothetical protein